LDERALIERARGGDGRAFRRLYEANVDRIFRLVFRMCGDEEMARDFTQDAFFRAFERLDQFRGDAAFSTWLHSIAVSVSLNGLRTADRYRKRERGLEEAAPIAARTPGRAEPDLRERMRQAIDGLPDIYRTVFLMHDLEGYNHAEIAAALEVAEGTSKARLSRARSRLRVTLHDFAPEVTG
jgi:RNA polymerase sigma-70 factor, ECF subfamily